MNKLIGIISTHAPTQGATIFSCQCPVNRNFNSRAHARRDLRLFSLLRPAFYFNSRAHARRDRDQNYWCPASTISTHAPTQGATGLFFCWMKYRLFQLTRPRKARQAELATWQQKANFNSRAHARRNISVTNRTQRLVISTHAPTQGATINHHQPPCNSRISTHAPTQGATE